MATTSSAVRGEHVDVIFRADSMQIPASNENIWDDTALIKAYDKAVESVKKDLSNEPVDVETSTPAAKNNQKRRRKSKKKKLKWNAGDRCQAKYSVDGIYYESIINSVNAEQGKCWVTFEEYGNEEEVELSQLRQSHMKDKHTKQNSFTKHDISENDTGSAMEYSDYMFSPGHPMEHLHPPGPWNANPWMMPHMVPPPPFMPPFAMPMSPYASHMPYYPRPRGFQNSHKLPSAPPPPPPVRLPNMESDDTDEALHSMLIAWYMSGYHTGYYQGLKDGEKQTRSPASKKSKMKARKMKMKAQAKQAQGTPTNCREASGDETL